MERSFGHRAPLLWILLPFAAGIALGRVWSPGDALAMAGVVVALAICFAGTRLDSRAGSFLWAAGLCIAAAGAGVSWLGFNNARIPAWTYLPPREAVLDLRIERTFSQPEGRDDVSGLAFAVRGEGTAAEVAGRRVYFSARPTEIAPLRRGSVVRVKGVLQSVVQTPEHGTFDEYLVNAGTQFRLGRGQALKEISPPGPLKRFAGRVGGRIERALSAGLEDRQHLRNIYVAMLLGRKAELGPEQEAVFMQSGTLHLFAISGLHIAAMAMALHGALVLLRVPRRVIAIASLAILWVYVEVTGAPPSAVRAWTMIAFLRAAQEFRWPGNAISAIAASAIVVLLIDPFQLFGASFQMSYAVVASLLLLGIPLADRVDESFKPFPLLPKPAWRWWHHAFDISARSILKTASICFAATVVSMPMTVAVFGWFTPGSFFANLIIVPLAILVVSAGFCAMCAGLAGIPWLPSLFNHAGAVVISVMEWLLSSGVKIPGIAHEAAFRFAWIGSALVALLLALLFAGYAGRWRGGVRIWMPAALVAAALAATMHFTGP